MMIKHGHNLWYDQGPGIGVTIISAIAMFVLSCVLLGMVLDPSLGVGILPYLMGLWIVPFIGFYLAEGSPEVVFQRLDRNYDNFWKYQRSMPKELQEQVKIYTANEIADMSHNALADLQDRHKILVAEYNAAKAAAHKPILELQTEKLDNLIEGYREQTKTYDEISASINSEINRYKQYSELV